MEAVGVFDGPPNYHASRACPLRHNNKDDLPRSLGNGRAQVHVQTYYYFVSYTTLGTVNDNGSLTNYPVIENQPK